jgi:hypothetical protein
MRFALFLISFLFATTHLHSKENSDFGFSFGVFASSNLSYRSAPYWNTGYVWPFASVSYKSWSFNGPEIKYISDSPRKTHWAFGYRYFDDSKPPLSSADETEKNSRSSLQSAYFSYQYAINHFNASLKWTQALDRFKSGFAELSIAQGIYAYTNAQIKIGYGSKASNVYAYGSGAETGLSNIEFSINSFIPVIDATSFLRTSFKYSEVLNSKNKSASLVTDDDQSTSFMILFLKVLK